MASYIHTTHTVSLKCNSGVSDIPTRYPHLPKLTMRNTADVNGRKPIAAWSQVWVLLVIPWTSLEERESCYSIFLADHPTAFLYTAWCPLLQNYHIRDNFFALSLLTVTANKTAVHVGVYSRGNNVTVPQSSKPLSIVFFSGYGIQMPRVPR
jgi:hypothetical protein